MLADAYMIDFSDAQAVTSIALLATANFFVCSLVLMSSAAHIGSLAAMHKYFDFEKHQFWQVTRSVIRVLMIATSFVLSFILFLYRSNIFPSYQPHGNVINSNRTHSTGLVLPAACFIGHPGESKSCGRQNFTALPSWTQNYTMQAANQSSFHGNSSSQ
ncbi:hypothetical protein PMIN06_001531 [Paraphaeosphaeria minitans]